ncbi:MULTISPECIES: hypothetical protein [unclassified Pseudonocardia]|uniref:hypothetical protein n=1 Tax=unclassified Pseudonocardia TaxID=2619320 RepID=UPI0001FFDB44|nr:hypothetical protein [Pseudonocardia sp. Ae707_Ps1]OLM08991.1 hypothetical protein Ae707Ps1_5938 [Pseudonocardia sp. Ae707_Ps1]
MRTTDQHGTRRLGRNALRALVPTTLVAALGTVAALTFTELPAAPVAQAAAPIDITTAAPRPVRVLVPAPPLPDRVIPELPLPQPAARQEVAYTCEPYADARSDDPNNPNVITNKSCPEINAAKEQAHREYAQQAGTAEECIGYGCSPEQDAEINRQEREANAGESAGRLPTSGETQYEYGCAQGYIPADQC